MYNIIIWYTAVSPYSQKIHSKTPREYLHHGQYQTLLQTAFSYTYLCVMKFNLQIRHSKRISELQASLFLCCGAIISNIKWKSLSHIRLFATPSTYTAHEILQARILEWVAFPFSRGSSQPRYWTQVSLTAYSFPAKPQGKPKNTGVGDLSLLQQIFQTQESNQNLLQCRWIFYQLSYQGSP